MQAKSTFLSGVYEQVCEGCRNLFLGPRTRKEKIQKKIKKNKKIKK